MANHTEEFILGLPFFKKVEKAIGYNNAVYELGRVEEIGINCLGGAFKWSLTPQGHAFWSDINCGITRFKAGD